MQRTEVEQRLLHWRMPRPLPRIPGIVCIALMKPSWSSPARPNPGCTSKHAAFKSRLIFDNTKKKCTRYHIPYTSYIATAVRLLVLLQTQCKCGDAMPTSPRIYALNPECCNSPIVAADGCEIDLCPRRADGEIVTHCLLYISYCTRAHSPVPFFKEHHFVLPRGDAILLYHISIHHVLTASAPLRRIPVFALHSPKYFKKVKISPSAAMKMVSLPLPVGQLYCCTTYCN